MRNFIDKDGRIAWIFDESTHPLGNAHKKVEEPVKKVETPKKVEEPVKKKLFHK